MSKQSRDQHQKKGRKKEHKTKEMRGKNLFYLFIQYGPPDIPYHISIKIYIF